MRGKMAPLYMVSSVLCFSLHLNFADLANACISLVHFPVVYMMCSLKFSLLSMMILRYFHYARQNFLLCSMHKFECRLIIN